MTILPQVSSFSNFQINFIPCFGMVLTRTIKTQNNPQGFKQSVVKKKINMEQLSLEDVETEDAASVVKKYNFENKHLFGSLMDAMQKTCEKVIKQTKKRKFRPVPHRTVMTYQNISTIPIQDIKLELSSNNTQENSKVVSTSSVNKDVLKSVLNFPLMDTFQTEKNKENTITESNFLRQYLEKMNNNGKYPSVTTILEKTMPPDRKDILQNWKISMTKEMGEEGFQKYQKEMLFNGSSLHQCITGYLSKLPELQAEVLPGNEGHWKSLKSVLPSVKEVRLLEEKVTHPFLCYKGVVDCLAKFGMHFVVIDWKTSKKPKLSLNSIYDNPLQIAAYVGALNFDPKFKYMVNKGVIVVAYENGTPATVHFLNEQVLMNYWHQWLQRVKAYWDQVQSESL